MPRCQADRRPFDQGHEVRIVGGQVRAPVFRTFVCGALGCLAAEILQGSCDINGAVGRLEDDVELKRVEERP